MSRLYINVRNISPSGAKLYLEQHGWRHGGETIRSQWMLKGGAEVAVPKKADKYRLRDLVAKVAKRDGITTGEVSDGMGAATVEARKRFAETMAELRQFLSSTGAKGRR